MCAHLCSEFPGLVSYTRFVELIPSALPAMCLYLRVRFGQGTGVAFIDSTPLPVCHNQRIGRHRVFAGMATRGKSSLGWFYGFKLHLIVNDQGELLAVQLTPANTDDRKPVPQMSKSLWGKLVGDPRLSFPSSLRATLRSRTATDHPDSQKHAQSTRPSPRQAADTQAFHHREPSLTNSRMSPRLNTPDTAAPPTFSSISSPV